MRNELRSIKRTPPGTVSRTAVRAAIGAVHVLETEIDGGWEVRTLGERGRSKKFAAKDAAIGYAFKVKRNAKVVVHQRTPRKITVAKPVKGRNGLTFKEVEPVL